MSFAKSCVTASLGEGGERMSITGLWGILQSGSRRSCRNLGLLDSIIYGAA